jgi:hypothetical protein
MGKGFGLAVFKNRAHGSVEGLLDGLDIMFDYRPSRVMREKFQTRRWEEGESFSNYMHEKIILGNCMPDRRRVD